MYNKYELLWLWYHYHTEKADLAICSGMSPEGDPDSRYPITGQERKLSNQNAMNNRRIIHEISEGAHDILYIYKDNFNHLTNLAIFELYDYLDREGKFNFIHTFVLQKLKEQEAHKENNQYDKHN